MRMSSMADPFATVQTSTPDPVAPAGTFDIPYPAGTVDTDYVGANPEAAVIIFDDSNRYAGSDQITFAFGAAITVTNASLAETWPASDSVLIQIPKKPLFADAAQTVDKVTAVIGAGDSIVPLDPAADLPTTVGAV